MPYIYDTNNLSHTIAVAADNGQQPTLHVAADIQIALAERVEALGEYLEAMVTELEKMNSLLGTVTYHLGEQ